MALKETEAVEPRRRCNAPWCCGRSSEKAVRRGRPRKLFGRGQVMGSCGAASCRWRPTCGAAASRSEVFEGRSCQDSDGESVPCSYLFPQCSNFPGEARYFQHSVARRAQFQLLDRKRGMPMLGQRGSGSRRLHWIIGIGGIACPFWVPAVLRRRLLRWAPGQSCDSLVDQPRLHPREVRSTRQLSSGSVST